MKRFAYLVVAGALLLAGLAAVAAWYVSRLDLDRFRAPVEQQLTKLLGRDVQIGQIAKGGGLLRPRFEVEELVVLADPVSGSQLARIDQARIGLDLVALLRRTVRVESIALRGVHLSLESDAAGKPLWPIHLSSRAAGGGDGLHVELEGVDLDDGNLVYHDGKQGQTRRASIAHLELDIHPSGRLDLSVRGEVEEFGVRLQGRVEAASEAAGSKPLQRIALEGQVGDVSLRLSGTAENALEFAGVDVALEAHAPRLPLPEDWGEKLSLEPVEASARLTDAQGTARLEDVKIEAGGGAQRLAITGEIDDLLGERRAALDATLELASVQALAPLLELHLPDLGAVRGKLHLRGVGEVVDAEDIDVTVGSDPGLRAHLEGTISDLTGLVELDLRARVEAPNLRGLVPGLDPKLQELGPLQVETHAVGKGSVVHLRDIDARLGRKDDLWLSAQGDIERVGGAEDLALELQASAPTTRRLEAYLGRELPELGPLAAKASLRGTTQRVQLERGELRVGAAGETRLVMKRGSVTFPLRDSFELDAELRAPHLQAIGKLVASDLPPQGPVQATGTLRVTPEHLALHRLEARIDRTALTGSAARSVDAQGRSRFTVSLASPELHLDDVLPEPGSAESEEGPSFRERRFPVDALRAQDAELVVQADRVLGRGELSIEDLKLRLVLEDGRLSISPLSFQYLKGKFAARAGVDASGSEASWWLRIKAHGVDLEGLAAQFTEEKPVTGSGILLTDLTSRGESGQELLENLDGDFSVAMRGGVLHGDFVSLLRRDLITALALKRVRPQTTRARCIVGRFNVEDGVVETDKLLVDAEEVLLHGRGSIDLGQERLDLVLAPKARRPGIGLMEPLAVKGSFQKPVVRPVKMEMAKQAGEALLGALLVPGVGAIAPFLQVGTLGRDPCAKALESYVEPE